MIQQVEFSLSAKRRGCHLVTQEILSHLPQPLPPTGLLHLFVKHTSCALSINENADPDVRHDLHKILDRMVHEKEPYYSHVFEGDDDMPAHGKCSLLGVSLTIAITNGRLNLGTWQGIYLCEFRNHGGTRRIVATIYS
ncbi:MAG: secondary thiamine-phosphate synthase enzyme YjbQ [Muribaculaceae bacterium]